MVIISARATTLIAFMSIDLPVAYRKPPAPLAFPHATAEDDEFQWKGRCCRIPKGTTVLFNIAGANQAHDTSRDGFDPDCSNTTAQDRGVAYQYAFGIGRRSCPGADYTKRAMFIAISKMLWAFKIRPVRHDGTEASPDLDPLTAFQPGSIVFPKDFKAEINVRSPKHAEILTSEYKEAREMT